MSSGSPRGRALPGTSTEPEGVRSSAGGGTARRVLGQTTLAAARAGGSLQQMAAPGKGVHPSSPLLGDWQELGWRQP